MRPLVLFLAAFGLPGRAAADLPSPSNFDGWYLTIGPVAGAVRVEDEWLSAVGLELSVARVAEARLPAAWGAAAGGLSYAGRAGGRLWLEAETAISGPVAIGLGVGVTAEVDPVGAPRFGAQATLWAYAGLVPYVRAGAVDTTGLFIELGVMLKVPVRFLY